MNIQHQIMNIQHQIMNIQHQIMNTKDVNGIEIDVCDHHGVFLDEGKLEKLAKEFKKEGFGEGFSSGLKTIWRRTYK